jgi:restriction system protein
MSELLGALWVWWIVGFLLRKFLFADTPGLLYWLSYLFASVAFLGILIGWAKLDSWRARKKQKHESCPHGIPGGKTRSLCEACRSAEMEQERQAAEHKQRREEARRIEGEADTLRYNEHARLSKLKTHDLDRLLALTPQQFEDAVAAMYRALGFSVTQTPTSNDFGRDLILKKHAKTTFVECKRYATDKFIGRPALQKFYAAIVTMKADTGIVVTTSGFAATAEEFAAQNNIELVDGQKLTDLMRRAFPRTDEAGVYYQTCRICGDVVAFDLGTNTSELLCRNGHKAVKDMSEDLLSVKLISDVPYCRKCGKRMRLVTGRRGKFWGCSGYPLCRTTQEYIANSIVAPSATASPHNGPNNPTLSRTVRHIEE